MANSQLIEALGYRDSQKFLLASETDRLPASELSFALRHTAHTCEEKSKAGEECSFVGTYVLQEKPDSPAVPIVHVFETDSESTAKALHQMVWNQNLVPFLIVASRSTVRVYPGFSFSRNEDDALISVARLASLLHELSAFSASAIDDGTLWQQWGHAANPSKRVDESLLSHLKDLDQSLQREGMPRQASHGLIGKFVYLYYLRHRGILSDRKLEKWSISPQDLFSRNATLKAFRAANEELQEWLNGSVFQLGDEALSNISQAQLRLASSVFAGDSVGGQLHLDFQAYDFSHIPIETLSCVYEQFLHDAEAEETEGETRGETLGAYYTPIPLADYVISEMERKRPLKEGMRVLDPSCGSGAFLVQCYRRLIEKRMRSEKRSLKTTELRELLTNHIFGIDRDDDACRVAELSLILTLLDYVTPPDLENTTFKLPSLRGANIFKDDFFNSAGEWRERFRNQSFDWVVGNPPWAEVKGEPAPDHEHFYAGKWISSHKTSHPTGGNQIAEAFLWEVGEHMAANSVAGLLVPAMTWFKKESVAFRKNFFSKREVWCLANFANFMEVLFAGRSRCPTAAVFFKTTAPKPDHSILTFAPFVAEQVANRPQTDRSRGITWNIVVNAAELREIENQSASSGDGLIWKIGMWGAERDRRLLHRLSKTHPSFELFCAEHKLLAHQGFETRKKGPNNSKQVEYREELVGAKKVSFTELRGVGRIFSFPNSALSTIPEEEAYVRKRGGFAGLEVSRPPHIFVDASRRFAVFSNEFIAVPPRQIGIASDRASQDVLRALSLYLSSDFCTYHQFLVSPQWGVDLNRADLNALKKLPVPLKEIDDAELRELSAAQRELASLSEIRFSIEGWSDRQQGRFSTLLQVVNAKVFELLALRPSERLLIEDFVRLNMQLRQGMITKEVMRPPDEQDLHAYLLTLRENLDAFLSASRGLRHKIEAVTSRESAFLSIALQRIAEPVAPRIIAAGDETAAALLRIRDRLRQKHSQWLYFDRSLKVYDRGVLYQFKPMQRLHWTRRQAVLDADEVIAEAASHGESA
jgi:hypothetical protein